MCAIRTYLYNLASGRINGPLAVLIKGILFLFSGIYGLGVVILVKFKHLRPQRLKARVISVGNITLGGTGKTTLVEYLANKFSQAGKRVAILTRGYERDKRQSGLAGLGDEPAMLQKNLPLVNVIVNRDRLKSAQEALQEYNAQILILDDGFQQWGIVKDLEIVTIDARAPFGNNLLLPAGFLREPLSALRRADIFVLTQVQTESQTVSLIARLLRINKRALIVSSCHEAQSFSSLNKPHEVLDLSAFRGRQAIIFSGIGNPQGFEDLVRSLGVKVTHILRFADHYNYTAQDLDKIKELASLKNTDLFITTQKDAVKISRLDISACRIFALNIKLKFIKNEEEFNRRLF